jgi:WD40 repeat protein
MAIERERPESGEKAGFSLRAFDWLFGYDYFLAHRSVDGKKYASALYDALTAKGNELDCFIDVKHYGAGQSLTNMQARALRKTSRLIVVVTPHSHDAEAAYVQGEVAEFVRIHPKGIIVPIGTWQTLSEDAYPNSRLLRLLPHLPDNICILETPEQLSEGTPSAQNVAKLLNDFSEERRSTKRLRWIRRAALLLLVLLFAAIGFGIYATTEREKAEESAREANRQLRIATAQRLAAEAKNLRDFRPSLLELTTLLSAEACRRSPTIQAGEALRLAVTLLASRDHALASLHPIRSAVFSPDATLCATRGEDGQIKVWNTFLGTQHGSDLPSTKAGDVMTLSDRGQIAVAGGLTIRLSDLDSGREQTIQDPCTGEVYSLTLSASGRYLCALSREQWGKPSDLCVWELKEGGPILKIRISGSGSNYPDDALFSPTEKHLAIKRLNAVPEIWNLDSGQQGVVLAGGTTSAASMAFTDDGRQFAAGDYLGIVQVWNVEDGTKTVHLKCSWFVTALAFDHEGHRLAAGSESEVRVWTIPSGDELLHLLHGTVVNHLLFSRDNRFLLTHSQDGTLRIWNAEKGIEVNRISLGTNGGGLRACFSPDGCFVAAQSSPNQIQIWRVGHGDLLCQVKEGTGAGAAVLALGNHYIATTSPGDETLRVWKLSGSSCVKAFQGSGGGKVVFSPKANYLAASLQGFSSRGDSATSMVWVYDVATGGKIAAIKHETTVLATGLSEVREPPRLPEIIVTSLAFSPDGTHLASASSDGAVQVTHLPDGRKEFEKKLKASALMLTFTALEKITLVGSDGNVAELSLTSGELHVVTCYGTEETPLSLSPDSRFLATVGRDSQVQIWNIGDSRVLFRFQARTKDDIGPGKALPIQAAGFSPDDRYFAFSQYTDDSRSVSISVWDIIERREVTHLISEYPAAGISFSPDARYLVTAGEDTVARFWQHDDLLQIASERISRNLSQDEWSIFIGNEPYRKTFDKLP